MVGDRKRTPTQSGSGEQVDAERPGVPDLARFHALVSEARTQQGAERQASVAAINALLIAMRAPGNDPEEARAILKQLDVQALSDLFDGQGREARQEAVDTLLHFGFPLALQVPPDDLAYAAAAKLAPDAKALRARRVAGATAIAGNVVTALLALTLPVSAGIALLAVLIAVAGAVTGALLLSSEEKHPALVVPVLLLLGLAVASLAAGVVGQAFFPLASFFANIAAMAAVLTWGREQQKG